MAHAAPIYGRVHETRRALDQLTPGRGCIAVGEAGSGRTRFASAVAESARRSGRAPLWIAATEITRTVDFGALSWLLNDTGATASATDALAAIVMGLRSHGGSAPTTLVVDDAHLLDGHSAEAVLQAVSSRAISLVATAVLGAPLPSSLQRLIDDEFVEVLELSSFAREAVAEIATEAIGGPVSPATIELLWRWSNGHPGTLAAIIDVGIANARFRLTGGHWWWTGSAPDVASVHANVIRRLAVLAPHAVDALDYVALAERIDLAVLEGLVGTDTVADLEAVGLIATNEPTGDMIGRLTVRCSDALVGAQRVAQLRPVRRRMLAGRLLDALPAPRQDADVPRLARLALLAGRPAAPELLLQASAMLRLSDPELALQIAALNHHWSPSASSAVDMVFSQIEVGDPDGARTALTEAKRLVATDADRLRVAEVEIAISLFGDRDPRAASDLIDTIRQDGSPAGSTATMLSLEAMTALLGARPDVVARVAPAVLARNDAPDVARLRAGVALVASLLLQGDTATARRTAEPMLIMAARLVKELPSATGMLRAALAFVELWRGDLPPLPAAHPGTGRWPAPPVGDHADHAQADGRRFDWAMMAGVVAHMRGDFDNAVVRLREAVVEQAQGKGIFHAEAHAWLVVALCDAGRPADAEAAMEQFPQHALAMIPGLEPWARGVLAATRGNAGAATGLLAEAAEQSAAVGATLIEARYMVELAERCGSDDHIGRLDALSRSIDAPLLRTMCTTAVARLKGDAAVLLEAASWFGHRGLVGRGKHASRVAERIARADGHQALARQAGQVHRRLSGAHRTRPAHRLGLSVREAEVAELAAGGLTDREIAARLVVSVRTIESHLASTYRKLRVSSRAELPGALA